jgi:hypothetical protein
MRMFVGLFFSAALSKAALNIVICPLCNRNFMTLTNIVFDDNIYTFGHFW